MNKNLKLWIHLTFTSLNTKVYFLHFYHCWIEYRINEIRESIPQMLTICYWPPGPLSSLMTTVRSYTATVAFTPVRPSASHPIGVINRGPFDQRPITAMVPLTPRPPLRIPLAPGVPGQVGGCEGRVARGVQWPPTLKGETVERPCPKGSLGRHYNYLVVRMLCLLSEGQRPQAKRFVEFIWSKVIWPFLCSCFSQFMLMLGH